jgi:uncharacterized protein (DUF1800 family)
MMSDQEDIALMAHLMRRAGFGASRDELQSLVEQGYEKTVDQLIDPPESSPRADLYMLYRSMPSTETGGPNPVPGAANWLYNMLNTQRLLEEKMALFWHYIFATANSKVDNDNHLTIQVQLFRDHGMGNYRDLLLRVAQNPAMIFWLDNNENHKRAPNENWGRELLELFSLGVGNYTEKDVFECARAFTGWTIGAKIPRNPHQRFSWYYEFRPEEHDYTEKTFLGQTGNFDGEDIIDIILKQPACPKFIARHLYNFFVADEAQVPAWDIEEPRDPAAVKVLSDTLVENNFDIKPVLRTLFNSDFFKESMYQKIMSPVEVVVGTLRLTGDLRGPDPRLMKVGQEPSYMGQGLHDPPSVEGWHTGREWINSGSVVKRINFVADRVGNVELPGVQSIIDKVSSNGHGKTPEDLVDRCVDLIGPIEVSEQTRQELISHASEEGGLSWATNEERTRSSRRVGDMLALIAATPEYQFG